MTIRKSDAQKKLEGTFRNDRTQKTTKGLPLGKPPEHLNEDQKKCWREIAKTLPAGTLTRGDRLLMEQAAKLLAKDRETPLNSTDLKLYLSILAKMGGNPTDRVRVPIPEPAGKNVFDKFFN